MNYRTINNYAANIIQSFDVLALDNFVTITQNNSDIYSPSDIVNICKRINNPKRDFLFVNSLQGKHLHVEPTKTFTLFKELVREIEKSIPISEKIVVIGFAETATAIGHFIASSLPNCIYYMQTTRETIPNAKSLLDFEEEHSHATEQFLYGSVENLLNCEHIIFVDDEISTGNTVLNFIREIELIGIHAKYSVATLLNWQNDEWTKKFSTLEIDTYFVLRGILKDLKAKVPVNISDEIVCSETSELIPPILSINCNYSNFYKERIGGKPYNLQDFSENIYTQIVAGLIDDSFLPNSKDTVLVLGTEEFMFTPMVFGKMLSEKLNVTVQFHATTRSPIETSSSELYAIHQRYTISSCYNEKRNTFIYNLKKYDKIYIITDVYPSYSFMKDISSALVYAGCSLEDIIVITLKG